MKTHLPIIAACLALTAHAQSGDMAAMQARTTGDREPAEAYVPAFELISFVASPVANEGVNLRWGTGTEVPGTVFTIQRSRDRLSWANAFSQDGEARANGYSAYEVMDMAPLPGLSYYRLLAVADGRELEMSDEFAVEYAATPALRVEGDLIPGRFSLHGNGALSGVQLLNNRGQFMPMDLNYAGDSVLVRTEGLEPGIYFVQATVGGTPALLPVRITATGVFGG